MKKRNNMLFVLSGVALLTDFLIYAVSKAVGTGFLFLCGVVPIACLVWLRINRQLHGVQYIARLGYYLGSLTIALAVFAIVQVQIEPPSDWPVIIYLGFLPIWAVQIGIGVIAAAFGGRERRD